MREKFMEPSWGDEFVFWPGQSVNGYSSHRASRGVVMSVSAL